jgi:hypothetical protein
MQQPAAAGARRAGHKSQKQRYDQKNGESYTENDVEIYMPRGPQPAGIGRLELRAPQHHVEVIGYGRKIAINLCCGQRLQLFAHLHHAVGHHAVGNKIFANIARLQIALQQPRNQRSRIVCENIGARCGEEVYRLAGKSDDVRKNFLQCPVDAAQEIRQAGADCFLRRRQFEGEQAARRQMIARGAKEFRGVKPVQLRRLRIRHIHDDHVKGAARRLEIVAAIRVMQMHPGIGNESGGLCLKILSRHADKRGVQLNQIDALDGGMAESLREDAACASADHQNTPRLFVFQKRVMDCFFGGTLIRRVGKDYAIFVQTADVARFDDRQVAVNRVARCEQVQAAPLIRPRGAFQPRRNINEKKNCEQRAGRHRNTNLPSTHRQQKNDCHQQVQNEYNTGDLERIQRAQ